VQDAAAAALEVCIKRFIQACEVSADSGMPDLASLEKEIAAKQTLLQKAISQPDTVQMQTVDTAMHVVQLMRQKFEGEQCLASGMVCAPGCMRLCMRIDGGHGHACGCTCL
jgi:hypothetical protein